LRFSGADFRQSGMPPHIYTGAIFVLNEQSAIDWMEKRKGNAGLPMASW
jgi:hypothetical protein